MSCLSHATWRRACPPLLVAVALIACSPTLNWRVVHLQQLTAMLPCKPDQAQRLVRLGAVEVQMRMVGCEADGALFAVSQVEVGARANVQEALAAWRAASLANLGGSTPVALPFKGATFKLQNRASDAAGEAGQADFAPTRLEVSGKRANASPVQGQLAWIVHGTNLYHIAVYGPLLTPAMTETLFTELQIQ